MLIMVATIDRICVRSQLRKWVMRALAMATALLVSGCITPYQKRGIEKPIPWEEAGLLSDFESRPGEGYDERKLRRRLDTEARSVERYLVEGVSGSAGSQFSLGIVEISDEGSFNPAQYEQVFRSLRCELSLDSIDKARQQVDQIDHCTWLDDSYLKRPQSNGTLLVVFVHGWHHSCRTCDRDISCFRSTLAELAKAEVKQGTGRRVYGLYVGWRGRAISGKGDYLSIWGRKRTAEHIGRTAGKELLNDLHELWDERENLTMVTVGHSLGGAFLLSAARGHLTGNASDIMAGEESDYRVVRSETRHATANGHKARRGRFGDLVVLLNPAVEAEEWDPFDRDLYDRSLESELSTDPYQKHRELVERRLPFDKAIAYDNEQLPIMVAISSSADGAVGSYFPISRWIGAINPFDADSLVKKRERVAVGHYKPHITHRLTFEGSVRSGDPLYDMKTCACPDNARNLKIVNSNSSKDGASMPAVTTQDMLSIGRSSSTDPRAIFTAKQGEAELTGSWKLELVPGRRCLRDESNEMANATCTRGWDFRSPYIVVQADKSVIGAHSDVFNPIIVGFLTDYLGKYYQYGSVKQVEMRN